MARATNGGTVLLAVLVVAAALTAGLAVGAPAAAGAAGQDCSFPVTETDATGTQVTIDEEPDRIVTTNPSAAQTLWEIGARDKVVGVTKYASYLEGSDEKTNVSGAGYTNVVVEKVVGVEPDLVLVPNATFGHQSIVQQLRDAGLTVFHFGAAGSLDDIREKTRLTGRLVGECEGAADSVEEMDRKLAPVEEAVEGEEEPSVLFVLGPDGYTAGSGTFIDTAIETAGGDNVAANANLTGYKQISQEVVEDRDPEWIVIPYEGAIPATDVYNDSTAVTEGNVLVVDNNFVSQPAPQIVQPIRAMAAAFHPDAWAAANATETPTPRITDTEPAPDGTPTTSPGFGVAAGLVALVVALALVRRR